MVRAFYGNRRCRLRSSQIFCCALRACRKSSLHLCQHGNVDDQFIRPFAGMGGASCEMSFTMDAGLSNGIIEMRRCFLRRAKQIKDRGIRYEYCLLGFGGRYRAGDLD